MPENENPPEKRNKEKIKDVQLFSVFFLSGKKNSSPKVASCSVGEKWCVALYSSGSFFFLFFDRYDLSIVVTYHF